MDVIEHNREAWNRESREGSEWCRPVTPEVVQAARQGNWSVVLTPNKPVPPDWFGNIRAKRVLSLASGGGQQAPVLAAAGAYVTSFDLSEEQLSKDREVASRESLNLSCEQGNMADLSCFPSESFDLIFHPVSNVFVPDVVAV
jgi:2-polyprenyl-3-methyl-5-hydroxy-6-metoxy-1,4-benzoquinol methylase